MGRTIRVDGDVGGGLTLRDTKRVDAVKSNFVTIAFVVLVSVIVKATASEDIEPVTVSPPIPELVFGPPGISDDAFRAAFNWGAHLRYPGHRGGP